MEKTALKLEEEATYKRYERSVIIPELKLKYEGKYFKGILQSTLIYSFVKSIASSSLFETVTFYLPEHEGDYYFEYKFLNTQVPEYVLQEEITKQKFDTAFEDLMIRIKSFKK